MSSFRTLALGLSAFLFCAAAQDAPPQGQTTPARPPTPEHPNGDYYADRFLCPGDIPVDARRGTMKIDSNSRQVDAMVYVPRGQPNGAAVIMLHGARGLRSTLPVYDPRALQLASHGYVVVMPQYYDATGGDGDRGGRNLDRWRDVADDAVAKVRQIPGVDPNRIGVWGFSLGGWLAAEAVMTHDSLRSAVAVSAGTDVSPPKYGRRQVPILMINARGDPVISYGSSQEFARDLRARGAEVDSRQLDSREHLFELPLQCQTFDWTREFFDRTLRAP